MEYQSTGLWRSTLGSSSDDPAYRAALERLRSAYERFRRGVALLAAEIHRDLPYFTVHDISHIDALWGVADTLCGPQLRLNPVEGFVLGGAFLLHDLGMGLASWPDREKGLKQSPKWRPTVASIIRRSIHRPATEGEILDPPEDVRNEAVRELLRLLHSEHAEVLADCTWYDEGTNEEHRLIEDEELRFHLGPMIGRISHSHWWNIEVLATEFDTRKGALTGFPREWTIDPMLIAAILRVADAAHLDDRRAPRLLRAARHVSGMSRSHWVFQGHLNQVRLEGDRLVFSATRPIYPKEHEAWWLAYETIRMVDRELHGVSALLADEGRPRLAAKAVAGAESPDRFVQYVPVRDWQPVLANIRVGDVARLVERLGGRELYGDSPHVPLRELIQNASDSVRARRIVERRDDNWGSVIVRIGRDNLGPWVEVEDSGIGMSKALMTGPLLDFGESYWTSALCRDEHPDLVAEGFEAVGRYGIGFFSVFMWGDRVRVATRRYDDAKSNAQVLEFSTGLRTFPILRRASLDDVPRDGGTRVRVWLRTDPCERGGLLATEDREKLVRLEDLCMWLAPALAVDLYVESHGVLEKVVSANDWKTMPARELLERITPVGFSNRHTRDWFSEFDESLLLPIRSEEGDLLGRLGLDAVHPLDRALCAVTVGGLRAFSGTGLAGILVGTSLKADRSTARPVAAGVPLADWATRYAQVLLKCDVSKEDLASAAYVLCSCGGSVEGMPIAIARHGRLTAADITTWAKDYREILLIQEAAYGARLPVDVDPNVLCVSSFVWIFHGEGRRENWNEACWPVDLDSDDSDFSTERAVLNAIAQSWSVPIQDLQRFIEHVSDHEGHEWRVGTRGDAPVTIPNLQVVRRPPESSGRAKSDP